MMRRTALVLALLLVSAVISGRASGPLVIDQLVDIRHPSSPTWSPDGTRIAFLWDRAGVTNIWVAPADGATPPRPLTSYAGGQLGSLFWSRDGARVFFARDGDLWQVGAAGEAPPAPAWTTPAAETTIVPSPDVTRVAFVRAARGSEGRAGVSELWVRSLADGAEARVASDEASIAGVSWSPDGARLAYTTSGSIRHDQAPAYSGAKIIYTITERVPGRTFLVSVTGGTPTAIEGPTGFGAVRWLDATHVVFDRQSPDYKRRTTFVGDAAGGAPRPLREDVDEKFWSLPGDSGAAAQPSPDGRWIAFVSDRDGWDHVYVMPAGGGEAVQITKGRFEAWRPTWSRDSTRIAFDANDPQHPGARHLGVATIGTTPARATVTMITSGRGTNIAPAWSPDGTRLVYQHTDPQNSADLFVIDAKPGARPVRLGDSMPPGIDRSAFVEPQLVHYAAPDGQQVPAYLFVPKGLDTTRKHPAIVWIHGDGINMNYDGWHVQRNYAVYYSFHQYLLQQGYVVLAPDYRGSIGYGKAWRQGVHMDVGGNDYRDAAAGAGYLKSLGYVDTERIGVWGLSYGGFFTLLAITDQPTVYRCAVDVAGVVDYAMYYEDPYHGAWTASRIGTPEQNPQVYAQASPLSHVDRIVRPLLVLHGTADVNVPYLHSVRLVDELLKQRKAFEFMMYPGEFHYFTREHVLRDAWQRVAQFFDRHLRAAAE